MNIIEQQQLPLGSKEQDRVLDYVIADIVGRAETGVKKYGTYLMTHNGRDPLIDAYQEALDLVMYLCQTIMEREDERRNRS